MSTTRHVQSIPPTQRLATASANLLLNPDRLDFGHPDRHPPRDAAIIHVVNLATHSLRIAHVAVQGSDAAAFVTWTTCTRSALRAEAGCIIHVDFRAPTRRGSLHHAMLVMTAEKGNLVESVPLAGAG